MLSTQYLRLFKGQFNRNILTNVSRCLGDNQFSDFQRKLTREELKKIVVDSASFDEKTGIDQVSKKSCLKYIFPNIYLMHLIFHV
jgi:hypothetical protein